MTRRHEGSNPSTAARVAHHARANSYDLERYARETVTLLERVNELIVESDAAVLAPATGGGKVSKRAVFPAPWNTPAGNMFTTVTQAARDHEMNLQLLLFARVTYRGTSDANSYAAIRRLPVLAAAAVRGGLTEHQYVTGTITSLAWWPEQLRRFLDHDPEPTDEPEWTKAPGNLRCPHCGRRLWLKPGWQYQKTENLEPDSRVFCKRCKDDDGHLLSWEPSVWIGVLQQPAKTR